MNITETHIGPAKLLGVDDAKNHLIARLRMGVSIFINFEPPQRVQQDP